MIQVFSTCLAFSLVLCRLSAKRSGSKPPQGISGSRSQTGHRRSRLASSSSGPLPDLRVVLA